MFSGKSTKFKIIAVMLGILVPGVPMLIFNTWLKRQGENEGALMAQWIVAAADRQIGETAALLQDLAARRVDGCEPAQIAALRQQVFLSGMIKELMVISSDGLVQCTDAGKAVGRHEVLASAATSRPGLMLDVVRLSEVGDRFLRVRQVAKDNRASLAALVPMIALLPHAQTQSGRTLAMARLTLPDGTVIGSTGVAPEADAGQPRAIRSRGRSALYGFDVAVAMENSAVIADYDDLRRIGMVVTGTVALVILCFAFLFKWRDENPVADVAKAILAQEFVPYYQPVVDIQSGRLLGCEVLVRWKKPDGTLIMPGNFIPMLESSGLILDLTRCLMRQVAKDLGPSLAKRPAFSIAFNVAPQHFHDGLILNDVGSIFDGTPIRLSQIVIELTERYEVGDLSATRRIIAALQGLGCKVAIDDVGAGHSGLSYILKLGVDIIKIDKIFVDAIGSERHSRAIIETMIDLARNMRMEIVAEGVETFDQVTYLREHGIRSAQGYVFAPPLPPSSFLELLEAMSPATRDDSDEAAPHGRAA